MKTKIKLSEREKTILKLVIQDFIKTARPVGSRQIWKRYKLSISPATIRNTMADLEEMGLLTHPHTSAGRIPTDLGYRIYVDSLMEVANLRKSEMEKICYLLPKYSHDIEQLLEKTALMLSQVSRNLGIILAPTFDSGILKSIEINTLSSDKILIVIEVESGLVKTLVMEIQYNLKPSDIPLVTQFLNERLAGLTLKEIQQSIRERCLDYLHSNSLLRLIVDEASQIFNFTGPPNITFHGTQHILEKPEFQDIRNLSQILRILENGNIIAHLFEDQTQDEGVIIRIGNENTDQSLKEFSLVASRYQLGAARGRLAVIGPKRMDYPRTIALVEYTAESLNRIYKGEDEE